MAHADPQRGALQHRDVVGAVAGGGQPGGRETQVREDRLDRGGLGHARRDDLEVVTPGDAAHDRIREPVGDAGELVLAARRGHHGQLGRGLPDRRQVSDHDRLAAHDRRLLARHRVVGGNVPAIRTEARHRQARGTGEGEDRRGRGPRDRPLVRDLEHTTDHAPDNRPLAADQRRIEQPELRLDRDHGARKPRTREDHGHTGRGQARDGIPDGRADPVRGIQQRPVDVDGKSSDAGQGHAAIMPHAGHARRRVRPRRGPFERCDCLCSVTCY